MYQVGNSSLIFILISLVVSFTMYVYRSKPLAGPAAVGMGLVSLTAIMVMSICIMIYTDDVYNISDTGIDFYQWSALLSVIASLVLAGYTSSKTWEDTSTMNVKIVMGVGLLPYTLIVLISFFNSPLWLKALLFIIYIPGIWCGHLLFNTIRPSQANPS